MLNTETPTQAEQEIPLVVYRESPQRSQRPAGVKPSDLEMIECGNDDCHWRGFKNQLTVIGYEDSPTELCPKCDSDDLGVIVTTASSFDFKNANSAGGRR